MNEMERYLKETHIDPKRPTALEMPEAYKGEDDDVSSEVLKNHSLGARSMRP